MANSIKSIFDGATKHLSIEPKLLKQIHTYEMSFLHKNDDHTRFFGGTTIGVQTVRFTSSDKNEWIDELLGLDEDHIRNEVVALPSIDPSWIRATNVVNLSCCYLVHRIYRSALNPEQKEQGMIDVLMVMQFRLFTSLLSHYYRYPVNEETAQAVYAVLSKKFLIKKYGNWFDVLEHRARDIIDMKESVHRSTIADFNDDAAIVYMIHDIQGRLKEMIKKMWRVLDMVRTQGAKILTVGGTIELDGKIVVKDVNRNYTSYRRYLQEIVLDAQRFIKPELIQVIDSATKALPLELFNKVLVYVCEHAAKYDKQVESLLDETLLHAFGFLASEPEAYSYIKDPGALLRKLRGLYMASRSENPALLDMRTDAQDIASKATGNKTIATLATLRTALLLYVVLRTISRDHYS